LVVSGGVKKAEILIIILARLLKEGIDLALVMGSDHGVPRYAGAA
jgi:hypothetical protein